MTRPGSDDIPHFEVMISEARIQRRVRELAASIRRRMDEDGTPSVLVAVWEGAKPFARDLSRALGGLPVHGIRASSYGSGTTSSGTVTVRELGRLPVLGQRILLIEDIVDTGRTAHALRAWFRERGAVSVWIATLLDKPVRRVVHDEPPEFVGFSIPDAFVIGYGMDVDGRWRGLPYVAVWDAARDDGAAG